MVSAEWHRLLKGGGALVVLLSQYVALAEILCWDTVRGVWIVPRIVAVGLFALGPSTAVLGGAVRSLITAMRIGRRLSASSSSRCGCFTDLLPVVRRSGLLGKVVLFHDDRPVAFTRGLLNTYVVISSGLVRRLSTSQLEAVLRHERCHAERRDPLRYLCLHLARSMLFHVPVAVRFFSRAVLARELEADAAAVRACGVPAVAGALLVALGGTGGRVGEDSGSVPLAPWLVHNGRGCPLEHRLTQLETGRPPAAEPVSVLRVVFSLPGLAALGAFVHVTTHLVPDAWFLSAC
ncbi:M56 family metallopeptidase [Streptomyces sp. NPDC048718]|uniref:M56 family metallopeptidase n=1 Tax=Streptomyces sp. NPDC048718 TaxID=3365587 RepID=UPI003714D5A7